MRFATALLAASLLAAPALASETSDITSNDLAACQNRGEKPTQGELSGCLAATRAFLRAHREQILGAEREIRANRAAIEQAAQEIQADRATIQRAAQTIRENAAAIRAAREALRADHSGALRAAPPTPIPEARPAPPLAP